MFLVFEFKSCGAKQNFDHFHAITFKETTKNKMSRLLMLADSNIYRNVTVDALKKHIDADVQIYKTTRLNSFELGLKEVSNCDILLVAALPNLICDAAATVNLTDLNATVTETTTTYINQIARNSVNAKRVLIVPPLSRSTPPWYNDHHRNVCTIVSDLSRTYSNMQVLPEFKVAVTDLLSDGVHLHPEAGRRYFDYFVSCLKDVSVLDSGSSHDDDTGPKIPDVEEPTLKDVWELLRSTVRPRLEDVTTLGKKLSNLEETVARRALNDDVVLARHSEELDQIKNDKWADRVVVVNFASKDYPKMLSDRKAFLSDKFRPLIESILGEIVFDIYPKVGNFESSTIPPFEIRFPTEANCRKFKQEAYKKVQENNGAYGDIGFHPKLTLASRVRVEVLRSIARKVIQPNLSAYCPIYNTRPILHLGPLVDGKVQKSETLTYVDAVLRFRHLLTINDLTFAYKRVGYGFHNCLRQIFIVLNDEDRPKGQAAAASQARSGSGRGTKRSSDSTRGRGAPRGKRGR